MLCSLAPGLSFAADAEDTRQKGDKVKGSHEMAVEMVVIHNIILRGINSVYLQCVNVERDPGAVADFVNYASVWAGLVKEHHDGEEELIFPELEELVGAPGIMAANVDQHHAFPRRPDAVRRVPDRRQGR